MSVFSRRSQNFFEFSLKNVESFSYSQSLYLTRKAEIRFISLSVFQFIFEDVDGGRVVFTFYRVPKGAEAADTDLILKFCWPNGLLILEMISRFLLKRIKKDCYPWAKVGLARKNFWLWAPQLFSCGYGELMYAGRGIRE